MSRDRSRVVGLLRELDPAAHLGDGPTVLPSLAAILDAASEQALPDGVKGLIARMTIEILILRPTMSLGLADRP